VDQSAPAKVLEDFRERVSQGNLAGIKIIQRTTGGRPADGAGEQEFVVSGLNEASARTASRTGNPAAAAASQLDPTDVLDLFKKASEGITSLIPRSEAHFLPDSVVGSITVDVDGEQATFYYLVDQDERESQATPISPAMSEALTHFSTLSNRLLQQ
jgi:hypothetical protein